MQLTRGQDCDQPESVAARGEPYELVNWRYGAVSRQFYGNVHWAFRPNYLKRKAKFDLETVMRRMLAQADAMYRVRYAAGRCN